MKRESKVNGSLEWTLQGKESKERICSLSVKLNEGICAKKCLVKKKHLSGEN